MRFEICAWLLSLAPVGSDAAKLRKTITNWSVSARPSAHPTDLRPLTEFPLESLNIMGPVKDLSVIREIKTLRSLSIHGTWRQRRAVDLTGVGHDTLSSLRLSHLTTTGLVVGAFPRLQGVHCSNVGANAPLVFESEELTSVRISHSDVDASVRHLPKVHNLEISSPVSDLPDMPELQHAELRLNQSRDCARVLQLAKLQSLTLETDADAFPNLDVPVAIRALTIRPHEMLELTLPELDVTTLSIHGAPKLTRIDLRAVKSKPNIFLRELPCLREIAPCAAERIVVDKTGLRSLRWLSEQPVQIVELRTWSAPLDLGEHTLNGTHDLRLNLDATDLQGFPNAPHLTNLSLVGSTIESLAGLPALPKVTVLDLSRTKNLIDAHALADAPSLTRIQCTRSRLSATRIPAAFHELVKPPSVVKKSTRAKKPKPKRRTGKAGKQSARLKKLLLSRDHEKISHAAELVGALDDPEVLGALLDGTTVGKEKTGEVVRKAMRLMLQRGPVRASHDALIRNQIFDSGMIVRAYREHAVRALLAHAPDDFLKAERAKIQALLLTGFLSAWKKSPVDLAPLSAFPKLKEFTVVGASKIIGGESLPATVTHATISSSGIKDPVVIGGLKHLTLHYVRPFPVLRSDSVETLRVCRADLGPLDGMTALRELKLRAGWKTGDLRLADLPPSLTHLDAVDHTVDGAILTKLTIEHLCAHQLIRPSSLPRTLKRVVLAEASSEVLSAIPSSVSKIVLQKMPTGHVLTEREVVDPDAFPTANRPWD